VIDGERVGEWHLPEANRSSRWREREFLVQARFTRGKKRLRVRVSAVPDSPAWRAAEYSALIVTPP
jgi:hypothetical protein